MLVAKSSHFEPSQACAYASVAMVLDCAKHPISTWAAAVPEVNSRPILQPTLGSGFDTRSATVLNTCFVKAVVRVETSIVPRVLMTVLSLAAVTTPEAIAHTFIVAVPVGAPVFLN